MKMLIFAIIIVLAGFGCTTDANAITPKIHKELLHKGFTHLGEWVENESNLNGLRINYYLSDPSDKETQNDAMESCSLLQGQLLFILNRDQDDAIRLRTNGLNEHFWTSGRYSPGSSTWVWNSVNIPMPYTNFVDAAQGHPKESSPGSNQGVTISSGDLNEYGWCINPVSRIYYEYRYICQFN